MYKDLVSSAQCGVVNPVLALSQQTSAMASQVQDAKSGYVPNYISNLPAQQQLNMSSQVLQEGDQRLANGFTNTEEMQQQLQYMPHFPPQQFMQRQHSFDQAFNETQGFTPQLVHQQSNQAAFDQAFNEKQGFTPQLVRQQSNQAAFDQAFNETQGFTPQLVHQQSNNMRMQYNMQHNSMQQTLLQRQMLVSQQQQQQMIQHQRFMQQSMIQQQLQQHTSIQQEPSTTTTSTIDPLHRTSIEPPKVMSGGFDSNMVETFKNSNIDKWKNSKFIKFVEQVNKGEVRFEENKVITVPKGQEIPPGQHQHQHEHNNIAEEWVNEFENMNIQDHDHSNINMDDVYDNVQDYTNETFDFQSNSDKWMQSVMKAREDAELARKTYQFISNKNNNQFINQESESVYSKGLSYLKAGELKLAIEAFEASVLQRPEHADSWARLGESHAENENETAAIASLLKAIELDPYHLDALMMLGVSYTNDLDASQAVHHLKTWLLHHPDYQSSSLAIQQESIKEYQEFYSGDVGAFDYNLHNQVTQMFLNAVTINPNDPEIYEVLGVLHHLSADFEKAIEAFQNAIKLKPDRPQLWNKLGATQANSARAKEAVYAYRRALELRPNYVRVLANLAISYANQGMHLEAARAYIATLKHNKNAEHIWSYLRVSLSHLNRSDLVSKIANRRIEDFQDL